MKCPAIDNKISTLLKFIINATFLVQGVADIKSAIELAGRAFKGSGSRDKARKILVVIVDNKSGNRKKDIRSAAKSLEEEMVRIIPVAIGRYADPLELVETSPLKETLVKVPSSERPKPLAKKILDKLRKSKFIHK